MDIGLSAQRATSKYMGKFIDVFSRINISLRSKILISFFTVILLLVVVNTMMLLEVFRFNRNYDAMITNITTANNINGFIKPAIDSEMWNIVAGKKEFDEGNQYQIIGQVNNQIEKLMANTNSDKSKIKLDVIRRTLATLTNYVDKMGDQMEQGSRVAENELVLENIRGVSDVVEESVQDYMLFEVQQAELQYLEDQASFNRWVIIYFILLPCVIGFSIAAAWVITVPASGLMAAFLYFAIRGFMLP